MLLSVLLINLLDLKYVLLQIMPYIHYFNTLKECLQTNTNNNLAMN